ncbi:MAG TPA: hypothetical protein PJ988_03820 [Anaerolinea sp.]|nr:hypothetical protein [Anaerolinea sp.]
MNKMMRFSKRLLFVLVLAGLWMSACAPKPAADPVEPTPRPTATATPKPTPKPTATATPNATATAEAEWAAYLETRLKDIEPDLTSYGYTLADGRLIWTYEDPIDVTVKEYNMSIYQKLDAPKTGNFILQTKITWNTSSGLAGCGIYFRQEAEKEDGAANQFVLNRLLNAPGWYISFYDLGQWQRNLTEYVYSNSIDDRNDATNIVALVVNGRNISPYINGKKQRLVEDITLKDGLFALSASQESGVSTCTFSDTWIWAIDKP